MRSTTVLSILLPALLAGCASFGTGTSTGPLNGEQVSAPAPIEETFDDEGSAAAGFDYDGRRWDTSCGVIRPDLVEPTPFATGTEAMDAEEPLHRVGGVDPAVIVATPDNGCDLMPDQVWASAAPRDEYLPGNPSAALNEAWCTASLYGPDPAEGYACQAPGAPATAE